MILRLVSGILALTFLPIGLAFVVIGLVVDKPDEGDPAVFVYTGAALGLVGLVFGVLFAVLQRREVERRRRRQAGLRAHAEIVRAQLNPSIRKGSSYAMNLTVRFATAGTPDGTASTIIFVRPTDRPVEGNQIEIVYDPTEPSNFEPALAEGTFPLPQG